MFQFSRLAHFAISLQLIRFPHSEITGSSLICKSPVLIAAYHVLHRLWEPRHPPCTLSYFLLRMPLLLGHGMSLFIRESFIIGLSSFLHSYCYQWLITISLWQNNIPTVVFSFFLLLPICQRTFCFPVNRQRSLAIVLLMTDDYSTNDRVAWWRITDSNRWPPACKAGALASWANPP